MTKITSTDPMAAVDVDTATDLVPVVDVSEVGNDRNKKMTFEVLGEVLASLLGGFATPMEASEDFAGGEFCNVHASAGAKIRLADASDDTKPVNGFVPDAIATGDPGSMITPGAVITGLAGLTPGVPHYLDTAAGGITDTPPAGAGNLVQEVGVALSATVLLFNPKQGVTI